MKTERVNAPQRSGKIRAKFLVAFAAIVLVCAAIWFTVGEGIAPWKDPLPNIDQISEINYWCLVNTELKIPRDYWAGILGSLSPARPRRYRAKWLSLLIGPEQHWEWKCPGPLEIVTRDGEHYDINVFYSKPRLTFKVTHRGVVTGCVGPGGREQLENILTETELEYSREKLRSLPDVGKVTGMRLRGPDYSYTDIPRDRWKDVFASLQPAVRASEAPRENPPAEVLANLYVSSGKSDVYDITVFNLGPPGKFDVQFGRVTVSFVGGNPERLKRILSDVESERPREKPASP